MTNRFTRRDLLAQDRTHLANERTMLAYWRTALACLVLGAFLIKFSTSSWLLGLAVVAIFLAMATFIFGTIRFRQMRSKISGR